MAQNQIWLPTVDYMAKWENVDDHQDCILHSEDHTLIDQIVGYVRVFACSYILSKQQQQNVF